MAKPASLRVSLSEAQDTIAKQLAEGRALRSREISNEKQLQQAEHDTSRWVSLVVAHLERILENSEILVREFSQVFGCGVGSSWEFDRENWQTDLDSQLNTLQSIGERLPLMTSAPTISTSVSADNASIFIVHGHDEAAKQQAARLIETLGLKATILHEQPNKGRTIIEKFEDHSNASFALVLLTPDDFGGVKSDPKKVADRARQNVIFELGFFFGKLGRGRVCALSKGSVEKPSDIHGILYVSMDDGGAWRLEVAKEMRAAGLPVDLNKL